MSSYNPDDTTPPRPDESPIDDNGARGDSDHDHERTITPARIGEYIGFHQCPRYFKHAIQGKERTLHHPSNSFEEAFKPLNILLAKAGEDFEHWVRGEIEASGGSITDLQGDSEKFIPNHDVILETIVEACNAPPSSRSPTVLYQASIEGTIGEWQVNGSADLILIWATSDGARIRVLDVKSAQEEKSYHQIQAATYVDLVRRLINESDVIDPSAVKCEAGIITRESVFTPPTPTTVPCFDVEPRIMDVRRLLSKTGDFLDYADTPLEKISYQLDDKCANCAYNESCATDAYEDGHLRLLGLSPAQQATLIENHDIETVGDLANLARLPSPSEWYPTTYEDPSWQKDTYKELKSTPGIGEQLPALLYRAEALADYIDSDDGETIDRPVPWVPGTGRCPLPEDDPPVDTGLEHDWLHGSMVRVYLNVQAVHLRDCIVQASGRVTSSISETEPKRFSVLASEAPDIPSKVIQTEQELLESFIKRLYDAIRVVANGIDFSGTDQSNPPIHFYLYTGLERNALTDAFDRHNSSLIESFQSLLEGPPGHDRPMISVLRPSVRTHTAVPTASPGLLPAYDYLSPATKDGYSKPRTNEAWSYTPKGSDESVNLRSVFNHRLFNYKASRESREADGIAVDPTEDNSEDGIPTRFRYGAEIPVGYLWTVIGRIDDEWVTDIKENYDLAETELAHYRYHAAENREREIRRRDVRALGRHLCDTLNHVERALNYRDATLKKEPYPLDQLETDEYSSPSLATACRRYLWIEHTARRKEEYDHYRKFPTQRMLSGKTLPVTVTDVDEENSRTLHVEGQLRFEEPFPNNAEEIRQACRLKSSEGTTSGSWLVANPYDFGRLDAVTSNPYEIEQGMQATLDRFDLDTGRVSFDLHNFYGASDEFGLPHDKWTRDERYDTEDSNQTYVAPGVQLILDPLTDDITAGRADAALEHAEMNSLHDLLEGIRFDDNTHPTTSQFEEDYLNTFADWVKKNYGPDTLPSDEQRAFIEEAKSQLVGLQGPPGTGKTAGAFAPALCARLYCAAARNTRFAGLVIAPSNTAIDELLSDVADLMKDFVESDPTAPFGNTHLVRIADDEPEDAPKNIIYIDYNDSDDDDKLDRLRNWVTSERRETAHAQQSQQSTLISAFNESSEDSSTQTLVFATPARAWRLVSKLCRSSEDCETAEQEYWDLLAADEASMLTLPDFLLAGSALIPGAQVLVGGDHRQLPPVQKHDWNDEPRRDIRATVPFLSTIDYLRLLRGEEEVLEPDQRKAWYHEHPLYPEVNGIPFVRLSETYRFGETTANHVGKTIYAPDKINYTSGREPDPISLDVDQTELSDAVAAALGDEPIVLIAYDACNDYQQWNPIEAALAVRLLEVIGKDVSAGVVTPHNAQRSKVTTMTKSTRNQEESLDDGRFMVETVNRFQGGESDLIIVSATVSDSDYISVESDFLLQSNRVNVSLTRHRDKLVVIAPKSLLGFIPEDPDLYDETLIWKELSRVVGEAPVEPDWPAAWSGPLCEALVDASHLRVPSENDSSIEIFTLSDEKPQ